MTSTNDGKDVKSNQTSGQKGKTYYIELYKSLEARLSAECTGEQRTRLVCEAWRRVHSLCQHSAPTTHPHLLAWLQRHTSHTILQTEWQSPKSKDQHALLEDAIDAFLGECHVAISTRDGISPSWESQLLHRAQWFRTVLSNPWGHPVLKALLDSRGNQPTDEEVLGWLKEERGVMFVTRLRQLAASKCDDLALLLAAAVMTRARDCTVVVSDIEQSADPKDQSEAPKSEPSFVNILRKEAGFTVDVWELLTDIEFVLLHKGESRSRCIELAKQTPLRNGYQLVERLHSRLEMSPRDKKLWKNAKDVATLIAQVVIARCMVVPICSGAARVALYGCARSLVRLLPVDKLPTAAAALAAPAATSRHLHTLATAVHAQCKDERKSFVCELYVRAITAGMNELERLKLKTEKESEARLTEQTLSTWFIQLGTLLSASSRMSCECVLTAFSVHPSSFMYERVRGAPPLAPILKDIQEPRPETNSEFGSWATDSRTQTNLVKTSETLNLKQTQKQANVLSTAIFAEGEALGLGAELCQDLAVLISGPRVKTLSWDMDRELLLDNCRTYMERTHGGTRALTTELKYLNLDPRSFQHLPEEVDDENDAFYGIEKGYEHLVEFQEPEEIWQDALSDDPEKTDSANSIDELPIVIPRRKKKSKRLKYSSDEETDPLSLVGDTKRTEKKERPHSKERSKERKERKDKIKRKEESSKEIERSTEQGQPVIEKTKDIRKKEKKKERKERKKKEKAEGKQRETQQQKPPQGGSLSRLVGMKVARITEINQQLKKSDSDTNINNNLSITDSDYDSQGKSSIASINSEGNETDVLFDGLFSMDEIKSPEKSSTDSIQKTNMSKIEELRVSNGIIVNNTLGVLNTYTHHAVPQQQLNFQPNNKSDSMCAAQTDPNNDVREEVKRSIKKLIEFRRNKNFTEGPTKLEASNIHQTLIPERNILLTNQKSYANNSKPSLESGIGLNEPKVFLNKEKVKQLNALKDEVDIILKNCSTKGNFVDHSTVVKEPVKQNVKTNSITYEKTNKQATNRDPSQVYSSSVRNFQEPVNKTNDSPELKTVKTSVVKNIETPSQIQYKEFLKQRSFSVIKTHPQASNVINTSNQKQLHNAVREQPSKQAANSRAKLSNLHVITDNFPQDFSKQPTPKVSQTLLPNSDKTNTQNLSLESPRQCSSKNLQSVPRQIVTNVSVAPLSPTQSHFQSFLKELQETINAGASKEKSEIKCSPISDKSNCSKQIMQQKKVDNAPNTFSRLSYLHKNKQNDNKQKVIADQSKPLQNMSSENKQNLASNLDKVSHLQSKGEIVISRIDKTKSNSIENPKVVVQKIQNFKCSPTKNNPLCLNRQYPIISNMLMSENCGYSSKILNENENRSVPHKNTIAPVASPTMFPTENDKNDLLLLLRQQSKMHPLKIQPKVETPKIIVDNSLGLNTNLKTTVKSNNNDTRSIDSQTMDCHNVNRTIVISEIPNVPTDLSTSVKSSYKSSNSLSELKKVRNVKGFGKGPRQTIKSNETSDWESVMNALLAQKTPSRGPNALDIVLKKDSFEKRSSNNLENQNIKMACTSGSNLRTVIDYADSKQCQKKSNSALVSSRNTVLSSTSTISPQLKQKQDKKLCCKDNIELGRNSPLDFNEKRFPDVIQNTNDPFISGIPNSDYDLLEELMDDDLRKEIGELMSDEEAYGALAQSPKTRSALQAKAANSFVNKYPNQKLNSVAIRKPQTAESCQNLDLLQNKNINLQPKLVKNLPSKCLNKSVIQTKSNSSTLSNNNANKKPRIISNELIASSTVNQSANLKVCTSDHPIKTVGTSKNNDLNISNMCSKNIGNNTVATSSIFTRVCSKPKIDEGSVKEIQKSNTDKVLNSQNIVLDPTRVILTVPQRNATPSMMLIGNGLICDPYSTIQIEQSNRNAYISVNQAPNLTLYHTTQFVTPCVNPVIIEHSTTMPVVRRVSPNISINISSNTPSETENNAFVKYHQENKVKSEVPKLNDENSENIDASKILNKSHEVKRNPIHPSSDEDRKGLANKITSKKELLSNKLIFDSVQCHRQVDKLNAKEFTQQSHHNSNPNINHQTIKTMKPFKLTKKVKKKIPTAVVVKTSALSHESEFKNPIKSVDDKFETEVDRERIQHKRMLILNRQISHRCDDKPIALTYKSITSTKEVFKSGEVKTKENGLENGSHYNKKIGMDITDEYRNDEKTEVESNINENQSISETSCQKSTVNSTKESENSLVSHCRRILLRSSNVLKDTTIITSTKAIVKEIKPRSKTKLQSLLKKRPLSSKPAINKVFKNKCVKKSTKLTKLSPFEKRIKRKTKLQKNCVSNCETKVNTTECKIDNKDKSCIEKTNFTCVDIEEQITSAIIPNIFKEIHNMGTENIPENRQKHTLKQNAMEIHPSDSTCLFNKDKSKDVKESNLNGHAKTTTKIINSDENVIEKSSDESKREPKHVDSNNGDLKSKPWPVNKNNTPNSEIISSSIKENAMNVNDNSGRSDMCKDFKRTNGFDQVVQQAMSNKDCSEFQSEVLNRASSTTTDENILEFKNKVIFEEIPSCNKDPLKKFVRIKLPNGSKFKATISGKLNVNVDSLFEDPKIKALLWKNMNNKTKCTLNIKQVAIKTPSKIHTVMTQVSDISYAKSPAADTETINLVSDDEDAVQTFKTEFGNYDIPLMNPDMFIKHQKRLSQKCVVKIKRCPTLSTITNSSKTQLTLKSCENDNDLFSKTSNYFTSNTSLQENITDYIEIDDSSNESEMTNIVPNTSLNVAKLIGNVDDLKNLLLKDLGVEGNENKSKSDCDGISLPIENSFNENITFDDSDEMKSKECLLRIEKCDELVKKMKIQKNMCFVSLVRCDDTLKYFEKKLDLFANNNLEEKSECLQYSLEEKLLISKELSNRDSALKRTGSLSILKEFLVPDGTPAQRFQPIENFNSLKDSITINSTSFGVQSRIIPKCGADWFMTKSDLRGCYGDNAKTTFETNFKYENENMKYDDVSTDCDSDIENYIPINVTYVKDINICNSKQTKYEVPSLLKLTMKYFIISNVNENLSPTHTSLSVNQMASSSPLKRKLTGIVDSKNRNKVTKIEKFSPLQNSDETDNKISQKNSNDAEVILLHNNEEFIEMLANGKEFVDNSNRKKISKIGKKSRLRSLDEAGKEPCLKVNNDAEAILLLKNDNQESIETIASERALSIEEAEDNKIFQKLNDFTDKNSEIEKFSLLKCSDETDRTISLKMSNEIEAILLHNNEVPIDTLANKKAISIKETEKDKKFEKSKESQQSVHDIIVDSNVINEQQRVNEVSKKNNKVEKVREELLTDNKIETKHKDFLNEISLSNKKINLDENCDENLSNIPNFTSTVSYENNFNTYFQGEVNEASQIGSCNKKLDLSYNDSQSSSIIINDIFGNEAKMNNESMIEYLNSDLSDDDKIEVIVPIEEIDDKNIQSVLINTTKSGDRSRDFTEKSSTDGCSSNNNLNKFDVYNLPEVVLNTEFDIKEEENYSKEAKSNSVNKCDTETLICNKVFDGNIKNTNIEILCDVENLQKNNDKEYSQNGKDKETTSKVCENIGLQNKNNNNIEKQFKQKIDINDTVYNMASNTYSSFPNELNTNSLNDNMLQKNVTLVYKGDSSVVLKGSIYEDPIVGTCYVFPILNRASYSDEIDCNNICDNKTINVIQSFKNKAFEDLNNESDEKENSNNLNVIIPKITYSRQRYKDDVTIARTAEKIVRKNLKRKSDTSDNKFSEKRYRKGKNIDYPKITVTAMAESAYSREYKRLFNYCSSIKFSFSRPFHKECIDVSGVLKCWPIKEATINFSDTTDYKSVLFLDENVDKKGPYDPLQQTLAEEISSKYVEHQSSCDQINENNFSMGFGEGSGRVINISEDGDNISKFSAATLSDVKQTQPFLLSEDYEKCEDICKSNKDQFEIFKRYVSYIQLRDKVRSFFKKTTLELNYHWLKDNIKNRYKKSVYNNKSKNDFPYDLVSPDFIEPAPVEAVVQVVQVGQLPVSAAAQNPVTCDPRVTQVTDASPSQCSVENSPHDDSQSPIKTEYTELTTADLSLPLVQEYERHMKSQESSKVPICNENIPVEMEVTEEIKSEESTTIKDEPNDYNDSDDLQSLVNKHINNVEYSYDSNENNSSLEAQSNNDMIFETLEKHNSEFIPQQKQQNGSTEKTDQIAHAMNAAGITTTPEIITTQRPHGLVNIMSPKMVPEASNPVPQSNNYSKTSINAMSLQQALAQILPPPLNQTNSQDNQTATNSSITSQVLHIVQGKNTNGNQITLVDNTQNSVINNSNTPVLHIVQNKGINNNSPSNANTGQHSASYGGLSLVDAGLQQGNNQLLHIVNTGNQKNPATGQLLKRVNLLTNLSNVQGSNDQKMVQFLCKAADGKSLQLNAPHQRSMVLRLQPIESSNIQVNQKSDCQDLSPSANTNITTSNKESINAQHEIKSRSVYEENYAKFIQNSSNKSIPEKSTSLPKFNQAFGKQVFQDGNQKSNDINSNNSHLSSVNLNTESSDCQSSDNTLNLDHIGQINSPPLLLRKASAPTTQTPSAQPNLMHQIKQTISPMNIQTMHGGVIYTRQIPVNIGGGQTINLITVPSTELIDEATQKQQNDVKFVNQSEIDSPIIKIVPQSQTSSTEGTSDENISHNSASNESSQNTPSQHQPVLTQMRIKLPMLSKAPQMVSGTRVVRPSFFQIQRNVIGGANQPVYQQLVLTAAPPLGQHTIRLPQAQTTRQVKVTSESQSSSESQMSSSTLEQLREFDMVLEQVKERSTVQPNSNVNNNYTKMHTPSSDTTDSTSITSTVTESTQQVLYSIGSNQSVNVAYVSRKPNTTTPTQSTFSRSPDSSGIIESPSSSTHVQIPHTVTSETTSSEGTTQPNQQKPAKVGSKSKSRPKSSHPPNSLKINTVPPKTSTQKPLEDEQTTQRILYILAEYKEQVENSPDKDKPAPRRRSNPPSNPSGSSKRKKSSSSSRRPGARDMSPVHGDETCRTMGSEDSSCGTSQGDCTENCLESHSPQDSPRKVVRKLTFENETTRSRPQPQRNVIVADGQTITVARGTAGKPTTAVLMPANYILPVSMVKGGQQIAIVTNRGPKLLTVGGGEGGATNALLLQRLIGPAGLKPVLARPGVRHVRLPTAALHNLQAFNLATATTIQPPDSTASPAPAPTPPELVETRAVSSPWTDRESQDVKPERGSSPEDSEPWNLPSSADPHDYTYEETVRTDNMDRTVLDAIPDRYSPEMEAQRIFDKMFDVDSKKSYIVDSQDDSRCAYDIDASDSDDKAYHQVVQRKDGGAHRQHRLTHVSAAALRHKYAILEHELRLQGTAFLQKSLSEECEDLGVDSPSASELFPEAELLFAASPAHDAPHHSHTPQPTILNQSGIPQPDIDDQIATDRLLQHDISDDQQDLGVTLGLDEGIVTVSEDGMQATIALDQEEFARSHPNTTFHSEPTDEGEVQPFTITGLKGRHITSTIFHAGRAPATVLVTAPQTTVISQAAPDNAIHNNLKFANINQIINSSPITHGNLNLSSVLVKDDGLTKFDSILTDSRELHLSNTASAIVHSTGNATQVIRRVCYEDDKRDTRFLMDEPDALIAGDDAKMIAEDSSRDATLESIAGDVDDDNSLPERHAELFWESNSASERSESRRPLDFSSDSEKCCKSPSYDETNSTDSSGVGTHMRLDSVIKDARGIERSGSADGSSADDTHPPLRTYPAKRMYHTIDGEMERSMSGKTRAGFQEERSESLEVRRRASGRGVVKRGCHCCNGSPAPPRPKKPRQRKPTMDFTSN